MHKYPIFNSQAEACNAVGIRNVEKPGTGIIVTDVLNSRTHGDGRIKRFPDGRGGWAHNWKTFERAYFFYDYGTPKNWTPEEQARRAAQCMAYERAEALKTAKRQEAVAEIARRIIEAAKPSINHPYLVRKQVIGVKGAPALEIDRAVAQKIIDAVDVPYLDGGKQNVGFCQRGSGRLLCVPLTDEAGLVWSMQLIDDTGKRKTFLKGGLTKGMLWRPTGLPNQDKTLKTIALCEGVATALSITHMYGVPAVAGLCAGYLLQAAQAIRKAYPNAEIKIYADRDANGVGADAALKVSAEIVRAGGRAQLSVCPALEGVTLENFKQETGSDKPTDYNDLMIGLGKGVKQNQPDHCLQYGK